MRFCVAQIGARRAYAVPAILARAGLLEQFYTDTCLGSGWGNLAWHARHFFPRLQKLSGRRLPSELKLKTRAFDLESVRFLVRKTLGKPDAFNGFAFDLSHAMIKAGFGDSTHFYSMLGEVTPLLIRAHDLGLTTITEIFILLSAYKRVDTERVRFPEIEPPTSVAWREGLHRWLDEVLPATSVAIAPAQSVADDLVSEFKFPQERVAVVPYAADDEWFTIVNQPQPGRILFAGTASLRKGIHYLGMAATGIGSKSFEFRVAGDVEPAVRRHPMMKDLTFLGRIARQRLAQELALCDLFVLPTLGEGSAEVIYQAMAAGVPVITTPFAGSVIEHGINGWIIPGSDADALILALLQLREDRGLRDSLAVAAKERAQDFTWPRYAERLLSTLTKR